MNYHGRLSTNGIHKKYLSCFSFHTSLFKLQEVGEAAVARSAACEHVSMRQITHALFV